MLKGLLYVGKYCHYIKINFFLRDDKVTSCHLHPHAATTRLCPLLLQRCPLCPWVASLPGGLRLRVEAAGAGFSLPSEPDPPGLRQVPSTICACSLTLSAETLHPQSAPAPLLSGQTSAPFPALAPSSLARHLPTERGGGGWQV